MRFENWKKWGMIPSTNTLIWYCLSDVSTTNLLSSPNHYIFNWLHVYNVLPCWCQMPTLTYFWKNIFLCFFLKINNIHWNSSSLLSNPPTSCNEIFSVGSRCLEIFNVTGYHVLHREMYFVWHMVISILRSAIWFSGET